MYECVVEEYVVGDVVVYLITLLAVWHWVQRALKSFSPLSTFPGANDICVLFDYYHTVKRILQTNNATKKEDTVYTTTQQRQTTKQTRGFCAGSRNNSGQNTGLKIQILFVGQNEGAQKFKSEP